MSKIAAFLGTNGGVNFSVEGIEEGLRRVGYNTGNMIFQYAMWETIKSPKILINVENPNAFFVKKNANVLVIPAANQINPEFQMSAFADAIEEIDLPCLAIGLGAQASNIDVPIESLQFPDSVIRFAKALSYRTDKIGIRGEYTKKVLKSLGIENTVICGCPSQMINSKVSGQDIQNQLDKLRLKKDPSIAILAGTLEEDHRDTERLLYSLVKQVENHIIVYQTDLRLAKLIVDAELNDGTIPFLNWVGAVVRKDLSNENFHNYLLQHGRFYSDARSWIDNMRRFDIAIGMRIHGSIAAIQAGKLGVCVAFDSRTLELAQTMGVPYIIASEMKAEHKLNDLLDLIKFDKNEFDQKRNDNINTIKQLCYGY